MGLFICRLWDYYFTEGCRRFTEKPTDKDKDLDV